MSWEAFRPTTCLHINTWWPVKWEMVNDKKTQQKNVGKIIRWKWREARNHSSTKNDITKTPQPFVILTHSWKPHQEVVSDALNLFYLTHDGLGHVFLLTICSACKQIQAADWGTNPAGCGHTPWHVTLHQNNSQANSHFTISFFFNYLNSSSLASGNQSSKIISWCLQNII